MLRRKTRQCSKHSVRPVVRILLGILRRRPRHRNRAYEIGEPVARLVDEDRLSRRGSPIDADQAVRCHAQTLRPLCNVEVVPTTIVGETCPVVACMFMMLIMLTTHIERVDLNLLLPLVALLEERHVSRAATRVGLSQPAMSRALQRLRRVLDDALLIRSTDGYRLTPRANQIHAQLATIVPQLESLLATEAFNPREAPQSIHLAGTDYPASALGPAICREILAQSPHSTVRFHTWGDGIADQIKQGRVDLGFFGGYIPDDLSSTELLIEKFVCVVAKDHPFADKSAITLAEYLQCKHVIIDVAAGQQTD